MNKRRRDKRKAKYEMIPGVPGFSLGGGIDSLPFHGGGGSTAPNQTWQENAGDLQYISDVANQYFQGDVGRAVNALQNGWEPPDPPGYSDPNAGYNGGGGGGGAAGPSWAPGEYELQVREIALRERESGQAQTNADRDYYLALAQQWLDEQDRRIVNRNDTRRIDIEQAQQWLDEQYRQRTLEVDNRLATVQEEQNRIEEEQSILDRELDWAIANNDVANRDRINAETERNNRRLEELRGGELELDRQIAEYTRQDQVRADETARRGQDISREANLWDYQLGSRAEDTRAFGAMADFRLGEQSNQIDLESLRINSQLQYNNNLINMYGEQWRAAEAVGNWELARDAEARMSATQQQNAALQHQADVIRATQEQRGQLAPAANTMANLASSLGNVELGRANMMSELAANPRDWVQLQIAQGGGQSFLDNLLQGMRPGGQSTGMIGEHATLGPGWEQLVSEVTQRRDLEYYDQARQMAQQLAEYAQGPIEGPMLTLEQLMAYGPQAPTAQRPNMPGAPNIGMPDAPNVAPINLTMPGYGTPVGGGPPPGGGGPPPGGGAPPSGGPYAPVFNTIEEFRQYQKQNLANAYASQPAAPPPAAPAPPQFNTIDEFRDYQKQNLANAYASQPAPAPVQAGAPIASSPQSVLDRSTETPEQRAARLAANRAARTAARA